MALPNSSITGNQQDAGLHMVVLVAVLVVAVEVMEAAGDAVVADQAAVFPNTSTSQSS